MNAVIVDGNRYKVVDGGRLHGQYYIKEVETQDGVRVVIRSKGSKKWVFLSQDGKECSGTD